MYSTSNCKSYAVISVYLGQLKQLLRVEFDLFSKTWLVYSWKNIYAPVYLFYIMFNMFKIWWWLFRVFSVLVICSWSLRVVAGGLINSKVLTNAWYYSHSFIYSFTQNLTLTHTQSLILSHSHLSTHSHPFTHSQFTHSLIHPLIHLLTDPLTHWSTHSLNKCRTIPPCTLPQTIPPHHNILLHSYNIDLPSLHTYSLQSASSLQQLYTKRDIMERPSAVLVDRRIQNNHLKTDTCRFLTRILAFSG